MKVIQSRINIYHKFPQDSINETTLLTWYLSVIMYKKLNFRLKFYCDKKTLEMINDFYLAGYYDEIDSELLESFPKDIDKYLFWATPKLLSYLNEGDDCFISDTDIIPFKDFTKWFNSYDLTVWSNKEFLEDSSLYIDKDQFTMKQGYSYPDWMSWNHRPFNTGIIYFKDKMLKKEFLLESLKFINNFNNKNNNLDSAQTMCFAEQRMIGDFAKNKKLHVGFIQPLNANTINENAWHIHSHKSRNLIEYNLYFLKLIKQLDNELFNKIIKLEKLQPLFEIFNKLDLDEISAPKSIKNLKGCELK